MREFFNDYVRNIFPVRRAAAQADWPWPGDEWVDQSVRHATWRWITGVAPDRVEEVIEYGPGSGKYSELLLAETAARVTAYEISDAFIDALKQRCARHVDDGRLRPRLIDWTDNEGLIRDIGETAGHVDFVVAIDVLMMMDLQSALVYLLSAALMLRRGGRLAATFADGGTDSGFRRMVRDAGRHSAFDSAPCTRFHWVDEPQLAFLLPRLGFGNLDIRHGPDGGLDIARLYVAAELVDQPAAQALRSSLMPAGDSTNRRAGGPA